LALAAPSPPPNDTAHLPVAGSFLGEMLILTRFGASTVFSSWTLTIGLDIRKLPPRDEEDAHCVLSVEPSDLGKAMARLIEMGERARLAAGSCETPLVEHLLPNNVPLSRRGRQRTCIY
jgi:hypothetical protein